MNCNISRKIFYIVYGNKKIKNIYEYFLIKDKLYVETNKKK